MVVVGSVEDPKTHYVYTRHLCISFVLRMFTFTGMVIFTLAPLYLWLPALCYNYAQRAFPHDDRSQL